MRRTHRDREGLFLLEGPLAIRDALLTGAHVREVFVSDGGGRQEWEPLAVAQGVPIWRVAPAVAVTLTDTTTPQGAVAIVEAPHAALSEVIATADLVVVLDDVRDPGNAGTVVRSSAAAAASCVIFTDGCVDPLHPKTVRASAGALFQVRVVRDVAVVKALHACRSAGLEVLAADAARGTACDRLDLTSRVAIVLGNEGRGVTEASRSLADDFVSVPLPGSVESLNVGIAGSILLFEAVRQRRAAEERHDNRRARAAAVYPGAKSE